MNSPSSLLVSCAQYVVTFIKVDKCTIQSSFLWDCALFEVMATKDLHSFLLNCHRGWADLDETCFIRSCRMRQSD